MNRLKEAREPPEEAPDVGDYFVLEAEGSYWYISGEMARTVDANLVADPAPEWTVFVDLVGSRVRLRTRRIEYLAQCTAEQRAARRAFHRRMKRERDADRTWDNDD
jgi:hypothetical protein